MEWNDPHDIALVTKTFDAWAAAVIAKDEAAVRAFHDPDFRVRIGDRLFDKVSHVALELAVAVREMSIIQIEETRRIGDILLVWSKHFIAADAVPPIPGLGLEGDWGGEAAARTGFVQVEMTVWRREGGSLKCCAFEARSSFETSPAGSH
jgi:hypothetical protein